MSKIFNIVIAGVGGQGIITLAQLIAEAAFVEGFDVKTSELHGLSQRGGSVETHVRFGEKIYSPLVAQRQADLIISLEKLETFRKLRYSSKETAFLVNDYSISYPGSPSDEEIGKMTEEIKNSKFLIPASKICQEKFQREVLSGVYLLGCAIKNAILPLKPDSIVKAIQKMMPEKYREINQQAFELGSLS